MSGEDFQQYLDPEVVLFGHKLNPDLTIKEKVEVVNGTIVIKEETMSIERMNSLFTNLKENYEGEEESSSDAYSELEEYYRMRDADRHPFAGFDKNLE